MGLRRSSQFDLPAAGRAASSPSLRLIPDLSAWPGAARRDPSPFSANWLIREPLAAWLRAQARELAAFAPLRILDVGCGVKPYYPFFAEIATTYVGVDAVDNPAAELGGLVERLPVDDASFDLVICTQVLEHCGDPARAVSELRRVTAPGGRVLASTHGIQVYHPSPTDYYRWTHDGLRLLFERNARWSSLTVTPAGGTAAALAMLLGTYIEIALRRRAFSRWPVWLLNRLAVAAESRSSRLRDPLPGSLTPNLHVVAQP